MWYVYINSGSTNVMKQLTGGVLLSSTCSYDLIPQLVTFCSLFQVALLAVHDADFFKEIAG